MARKMRASSTTPRSLGIEMSVDAHSPLVLVHLDDNAVGISINKSAKFPFKIKDVFIGPIEF